MRIYKTRADFDKLQSEGSSSLVAGTVCTITDEPTNPMYVYQGGVWNSTVTATTNPVTGRIEKTRRAVFEQNPITPLSALATVQTNGTVTQVGTDPKIVTCTATASVTSAARIFAGKSVTLDTAKIYELSATVESASISVRGGSGTRYGFLGVDTVPTTGTQQLLVTATQPVAGTRYAVRFQPSTTAINCRFGLGGINTGDTVTAGDSIVFKDVALYEVDSLTGAVLDYSFAPFGVAGKAPSASDSVGSTVLFCGDSWFNDATDAPAILSQTYRREAVLVAHAGDTLAAISTALAAARATGAAYLNLPHKNIPTISVIEGGINDIIGGATGDTMLTRLMTILTPEVARGSIPLIVLPVLATDGSNYTAQRAIENAWYRRKVFELGYDVIDGAEYFLNADGTANTTYLTSETGAWIHPSAAGYALFAKLIDQAIRRVESAYAIINVPPATW